MTKKLGGYGQIMKGRKMKVNAGNLYFGLELLKENCRFIGYVNLVLTPTKIAFDVQNPELSQWAVEELNTLGWSQESDGRWSLSIDSNNA